MAITTKTFKDFDVQILVDTVRGDFAQKTAFMDSPLVAGGAVIINDSMKESSPKMIGTEITVPYFGTVGDFVDNPDGSSVVPVTLGMTNEKSAVTRDSLGIEMSTWSQNAGTEDMDPYKEGSRQIVQSGRRAMDKRIITAAAGSPLVHDVYSTNAPQTLNYDVMADGTSKWGDEYGDVVAMICHSRALTDLRKLKDGIGRNLLVESQRFGEVPLFMGVPVVQSDRVPLTGSTMGTVTPAGTTPPVLTITGAPLGAFDLRIKCVLGGAHTTALIQFSTDGGNTWSANLTTLAAAAPLPLIDTATDSLLGVNGKTGLFAAFAAGTFNVDNTWASKANLKVSSMVVQRGALAFWYNRMALGMKTDQNIMADTDLAAMHLYAVAHRYRRVPGKTKPGVLVIKHNVSSYQG
jgi:hypothetical protein